MSFTWAAPTEISTLCRNRLCRNRLCSKKNASISRFDGGVVQGNQFPRRIVLLREGILGVGVYDLEHVAGALGAENEALLFDRNHSVPIFEYRSLFHELLDARFRTRDTALIVTDQHARLRPGAVFANRTERNCVMIPRDRRSAAGFPFIFFHHAVFNVDHAMRVLSDIVLMRYQHDCISLRLQAIENRHNFISGL
jgi:hypothetical protein